MSPRLHRLSALSLAPICLSAAPELCLRAGAQTFADRTADLGLTPGNGPAGFGDVNNDGFPDLYAGGAVWLNDQGKSFSRAAAPGQGIIVDFNNDGLGDLVSIAPIALYRTAITDQSLSFVPVELPALPETVCRGVASADFNNDAKPDFYFTGYENWEKQITYPSLLLISSPDGYAVRIITSAFRSRGVTACDFDQDNDIDIYVSNYRLQPNLLWINDGHGELTDQAAARNALATTAPFKGGHSIGASFADFDNDGRFDLFAGNFAHVDSRGDQPKSRFLRNLGPDKSWAFDDLGTCGIWYQESYASPAAADFDNDTRPDLYFTTVYADASFGKKNFPVLYRNAPDAPWSFKDVTEGSGLEKLPPTYQAAWADINLDGKPDLLTAGRLFINTGAADTHWLELRLQGDGARVNRYAIGAQARITLPDGRILTRQVEAGTGECNANSPILHFGLGDRKDPIAIDIHWPDGLTQSIQNTAVDQVLNVSYAPAPAHEAQNAAQDLNKQHK